MLPARHQSGEPRRSMNIRLLAVVGCMTALSAVFVSGQSLPLPKQPLARIALPQARQQTPSSNDAKVSARAADVAEQRALIDRYCVTCHNTKAKTANLMLDQLDLAHLGEHAEIGEKVVRKLRAGMMPP